MSYIINASMLNKLYGQRIEITATSGESVIIDIPCPDKDWPRRGTEAYGLKVDIVVDRNSSTESFKAFLKIFQTEVPEREERTRYLISKQLAKKDICYHGIPFGWLGHLVINDVPLIAHFTRMIAGPYRGGPEDFERLRSTNRWDSFTQRQRRRHAGELVAAIIGLEAHGIVHGDISPPNILFGSAREGGDLICILCDYDGFHAPDVPRLPRKAGGMMCRPLGSEGYQHPDLVDALDRDTSSVGDIFVDTDRFALGVAVCEMMVWGKQVDDFLANSGRGRLLSESIIRNRDISEIPKEVLDVFPEGFALLDKSLRAQTANLPTPDDWLQVLGLRDQGEVYRGRPLISIFQRNGNQRRKIVDLRVANQSGKLSTDQIARLSQLTIPSNFDFNYNFSDSMLSLEILSHTEIKRRRFNKLRSLRTEISSIYANPKDVIYVDDIEIEFSDVRDIIRQPNH